MDIKEHAIQIVKEIPIEIQAEATVLIAPTHYVLLAQLTINVVHALQVMYCSNSKNVMMSAQLVSLTLV